MVERGPLRQIRSMVATVNLLKLKVLVGHEVQRSLLQPEPDDALLRLEAHAARRVEGGDDGRVLLGALRAHDGLAAPENVGRVEDLLLLHSGRHLVIVGDDTRRQRLWCVGERARSNPQRRWPQRRFAEREAERSITICANMLLAH